MGFSQSGDTKADLKTEVMPREKTGLGEVAGTAVNEGGHRGSQTELKREVKSGKNEVYPVQAKKNFHLESPLTAILQPGEELCSLTASCSIVPFRHHAACQQFGKRLSRIPQRAIAYFPVFCLKNLNYISIVSM